MAGSAMLSPALALVLIVGGLAVAVYGLVVVPPVRHLAYLLPAGLVGAVLGQVAGVALGVPSPALGGLHVVGTLVGTWLLVSFVRRMLV